jgi:hypothetical protein
MKMKSLLVSVILVLSSSAAMALDCKGADLSFSLTFDKNHNAIGVSHVSAADSKLAQALEQSSKFFGPDTSNDVTLPDFIQASFPTTGYWTTGIWTLSMDPKTGTSVLAFDDYDGDMRSFDLICR